MRLLWTKGAWSDYLYWQDNDPILHARVNSLVRDIERSAFTGIGKPEPLKGDLSGYWSRRIDSEHRLVYRVIGKGAERRLEIIRCRYHY